MGQQDNTERLLFELQLKTDQFKAEQQAILKVMQKMTESIAFTVKAQQGLNETRAEGGKADQSYAQLTALLAGDMQRCTLRFQEASQQADVLQQNLAELEATYREKSAEAAAKQVQELGQEMGQAATATKQYGSSVVELKRKLADLTTARDLSEDKEQVNGLNAVILETKGALQEATGKVDEFGDKIEKNSKKEEIATLGDAFQGVTAAIALSTLAFGESESAQEAAAQAAQYLAGAEALRNLQIGLASAKDAGHIVLLKARNLLFAESAVVTTTSTAATVSQTAATEGATLAQRALNVVMRLNPIGLIVVAIGALIGGFLAWRNASDETKRKVADLTEKVLRFGTPIGLVITGFQKLYEKSEAVRKVFDPLGEKLDMLALKLAPVREFFSGIADRAVDAGRDVGEYIGLLDTAAEKAAKASARAVEGAEKEISSYQLRARQLELQGTAIEQFRSTEREGLVKNLAALQQDNALQADLHRAQLSRIDEKQIANEKLSKAEQTLATERKARQEKLVAAQIQLTEFDQATQTQLEARTKAIAAARRKELDDAKSDAERKRKLAEQQLKDAYATQKQLLDNQQQQNARALAQVESGSQEELRLLRDKARLATAIQLVDNSSAQVGLARKQAQAVADARLEITANGQAQEQQLERDHVQKLREIAAESQQTALAAQIARAQEGSQEEFLLKAQAIQAQVAASLAGIDQTQSAEQQAAEEDKIRAEGARQSAELEFQQALALLETHLTQQRTLTNQQYANGQLTKAQHEANIQALEQAGQSARIVTLQDYGKSAAAEEETQSQHSIEVTEEVVAKKQQALALEDQLRQQGLDNARTVTDGIITLFGEETAAGQASLAIRKTLAVADIALGLQKQLAANAEAGAKISASAPPVTLPLGIAYTIGSNVLSVAAAAAATAKVLAFAQGGVLHGPSHAQGGIPFTIGGRPGFEAEGGEVILAKGVWAKPELRPLVSMLNMLGGGKSLHSGALAELSRPLDPKFAEGGIVRFDPSWMPAAAARNVGLGASLATQVAPIDYEQLARAVAAHVVPGIAEANKALPAPKLNLTELREKQQKLTRNEQRADL